MNDNDRTKGIFWSIIIVALIAIGVYNLWFSAESSSNDYYKEAKELEKSHKTNEAIAMYGKAIEANPESVKAYLARAKAYQKTLRREDIEKAFADFNKAIQLEPKNGDGYIARGELYEGISETQKALADFNKAIEVDSKNADAYIARGSLYEFAQNDYNKAIADYTSALNRNYVRNYAKGIAYHNRGRAYRKQGDLVSAIDNFTKAIETGYDKGSGEEYYSRAECYAAQGELNKAIADLSKAIEIEPGNEKYYEARGKVHQALGNTAQAEKDLNHGLEKWRKYGIIK